MEIFKFVSRCCIWLEWCMWTILSAGWRFAVAVFDYRTHIRFILGQPLINVAFVTNMRDRTDWMRYLGFWKPRCNHFNGPRYWFGSVSARVRALAITAEEMATSEGRIRAREYFIDAVKWAEKRGVKVILLAAHTKRLFGNGDSLRRQFPGILFVIGDNGTFSLLENDALRALKESNVLPGSSRIAILGPYGHLGEAMLRTLLRNGYDVIGAGPNGPRLSDIRNRYHIQTCLAFEGIGKVDAVIACANNESICLTAESVDLLRRESRRLLVVDVAEPPNFKLEEWRRCKQFVVRQDAGNAYNPKLHYVLGALSYRMFRQRQGETFGCFSEAIALARAIQEGRYVHELHDS